MTKSAAAFLLAAAVAAYFGFLSAEANDAAAGQIAFFLCSIGLLVSLVLGSQSEVALRPSRINRKR